MRKIKLNTNAFLASKDEKKFIVLNSEKSETGSYEKIFIDKINTKNSSSISGLWGTLGFANDAPINWKGHLEISNDGNDNFVGPVAEEVGLLKQCHPHLNFDSNSIKEKFISFKHLDIPVENGFGLDEIPELRLELMLEKNEGAIVFYQMGDDEDEETAIEYIQPQKTEGFNIDERDRLTYKFDIIPQNVIKPIKGFPEKYTLDTEKDPKDFLIKIITFIRTVGEKSTSNINSKDVILEIKEQLNKTILKSKLHKPHKILIYKREDDDFVEALPYEIKADKKTLFLMHGTFGSTQSSFESFYNTENSLLSSLTNPSIENHYEQVLSFDHPTLFFGAEENIEALFQCLTALNFNSFKSKVDFIGTSQGSLLIKYLANNHDERIIVGKAILISSANGVGYFTVGKFVARFLSILKRFFKSPASYPYALISAVAQHSAEFLLEQPGFQIMTPNSEKLNNILKGVPKTKDTCYYPIINDYDESILENENRKLVRFFKKMGGRLIDAATKKMLGEYNDWVVGSKEQFIVPSEYCVIPDYHPGRYNEYIEAAIHCKCQDLGSVHNKISKFLIDDLVLEERKDIDNYFFDAHCHILGRGILTPRIIYLLIEELVEINKEISSGRQLPLIDLSERKSEQSANWRNILNYFFLNKTSINVFDDLQKEYRKLKSNVFRYIPLMIDLEMSFRNKYVDNGNKNILSIENDFSNQLSWLKEKINSLIDSFEKHEKLVFSGAKVENEDSIEFLKIIKSCFKFLKLIDPDKNSPDITTGYEEQINEMEILKKSYGNNIFPFLAVDPRRERMAEIIKEQILEKKIFHGIKLYPPNGYSPTDPNLFDDGSKFIEDMCLYSFCIKHNIPVMTHASDAGFSTFVKELEVQGEIYENGRIKPLSGLETLSFNYDIFHGGFKKAVRERAQYLNHPKLWEKVVTRYKDLKICFGHFGGLSNTWRSDIADLIKSDNKVYTDLSCITDKKEIKNIRKTFIVPGGIVSERIMYGSDFHLNTMGMEFSEYYENFKSVFTEEELKKMSKTVPNEFLKQEI